jgi:putative endonuclease
MTNRKNGTLYVGVTSDLYRRINEHKTGSSASFTKRYALCTLVYIEQYKLVTEAIAREKQLKARNRKVKVDLITSLNPEWRDLAEGWY